MFDFLIPDNPKLAFSFDIRCWMLVFAFWLSVVAAAVLSGKAQRFHRV